MASREGPEPPSAQNRLLERGEKQGEGATHPFSAFPGSVCSQGDLSGVSWEAPLGFGRVASHVAAGFLALRCCENRENPSSLQVWVFRVGFAGVRDLLRAGAGPQAAPRSPLSSISAAGPQVPAGSPSPRQAPLRTASVLRRPFPAPPRRRPQHHPAPGWSPRAGDDGGARHPILPHREMPGAARGWGDDTAQTLPGALGRAPPWAQPRPGATPGPPHPWPGPRAWRRAGR